MTTRKALIVDSLIRQDHLADPAGLRSEFDSAKPFRHLVLDDFFTPDYARSLLQEFPPFDTALARNEAGKIGGKCVHEKLAELAPPYQRLDELIQSREFLAWLEALTGIDELLYDPNYFGGGTHENRHGQDLDPHVDFNKHPETGLHRRLNLIVYLNEEWQDDWGGAIEFHQDPRLPPEENRIEYVNPKFNRAVLFETTHWSWHGFERINLPEGDADPRSRKSVALYFYSRTRPEKEQTKPHSTIYVERPLPSHIQPNQPLGDAEYQQVQGMLRRRDEHLQRLYGNISDLSAHVEDLIAQRDQAMRLVAERDQEVRTLHELLQAGWIARARRWLGRRLGV
ncbi:2OG-Fe(II) oxygenase [Wenzhouxiangella marina]|uniref:Proline hydroxylase-like protein n=1 Tax=Wenzhouxiangella marina TaxID=1579979 RepID=A0A0K0XZS4_9GAMM|nr:2OG-Fe(II) oxygenase [Wenzhouxiangella marina]AKS43170.1 Proline hydroxylase-like protein [Wenzhouxiangella marina]MBB6087145.1 hypothetical protein [Wenzhouxiangella marina]